MIQSEKRLIRKQIQELKKNISIEQHKQKSDEIFKTIETFDQFKLANTILLYWSMPDEVYTHDFVNKWYKKKTILLPSVNGNQLDLKTYTGLDSLVKGEQFGIEEPSGENFTEINKIDLAIIPGIAFDKQNNRMGRGRGFYDRFLSEYKGVKIGICFDFQIIETIPNEPHDVAMNNVVFA